MPNSKQVPEIKQQPNKYREPLEQRTLRFAREVRAFVRKLPRGIIAIEDAKQLVRSSGSVGANYIEANESLSKKDFGHRIKICRKEAKESKYWLELFDSLPQPLNSERERLMHEATAFVKMFSSIVSKL